MVLSFTVVCMMAFIGHVLVAVNGHDVSGKTKVGGKFLAQDTDELLKLFKAQMRKKGSCTLQFQVILW